MSTIVDTLLNIMVFVFVGLLIWLYVRKEPEDSAPDDALEPSNEKKG